MHRTILLIAALLAGPTMADTLQVAVNSSSGTYKQMFKEISDVCSSPELTLTPVDTSGGAVENLSKLVNNQVSGAMLHSDVIFWRDRTQKLSDRFKTLITLYPEEVHFIGLSSSGRKSGGTFGFGKKDVVFNTVSDLSGYKVGAAGGGVISANLIRATGGVNYEVVPFNDGQAVLNALRNGHVDAAVFVGGAPLPNLVGLDQNYKLLEVPENVANNLKDYYIPAKITYTNIQPNPVSTVAAQALLVVRAVKGQKAVTSMRAFRSCFYSHLTDIQEATGTHPKWQDVSDKETAEETTRWAWLDLGDSSGPPEGTAKPRPDQAYRPDGGHSTPPRPRPRPR